MKKFFLAALALLALAPFSFEARAQTVVNSPAFVNPCVRQASPLTGCILVDAAHPLPVSASVTPSGTQDINIKQVNGSNVTSVPVNDNAGSLTVDGTVAATQSGTWTVQPGNTPNTTPWLVTNVRVSTGLWSYAAATGGIVNTTTAVTVKTAAGASVKNCIASGQVYATALGAATELVVRDGAAGTVIWRAYIGTAGLAGLPIVMPAGLCGTANTLLEVATLSASITGGVYVNLQGYTAP